jgi:hypothetical protein
VGLDGRAQPAAADHQNVGFQIFIDHMNFSISHAMP